MRNHDRERDRSHMFGRVWFSIFYGPVMLGLLQHVAPASALNVDRHRALNSTWNATLNASMPSAQPTPSPTVTPAPTRYEGPPPGYARIHAKSFVKLKGWTSPAVVSPY